jgi:hypothetical protein
MDSLFADHKLPSIERMFNPPRPDYRDPAVKRVLIATKLATEHQRSCLGRRHEACDGKPYPFAACASPIREGRFSFSGTTETHPFAGAASHDLNASVYQHYMQHRPHGLVVGSWQACGCSRISFFLTSVCPGLLDYSEATPVMAVLDCTTTTHRSTNSQTRATWS